MKCATFCRSISSLLAIVCCHVLSCSSGPSVVPMPQPDAGAPDPLECGTLGSVAYGGACTCTSDCAGSEGGVACAPELPDGPPGNACLKTCHPSAPDCPIASSCKSVIAAADLGLC